MDLCRRYDFKQFGHKVTEMICEACACKDCPCLEEYFHTNCAECKKDFYKMYAGYCGECDNMEYFKLSYAVINVKEKK